MFKFLMGTACAMSIWLPSLGVQVFLGKAELRLLLGVWGIVGLTSLVLYCVWELRK